MPDDDKIFYVIGEDGHVRPMDEIRAEIFDRALARYGGKIDPAARYLKVSRTTVYNHKRGNTRRKG